MMKPAKIFIAISLSVALVAVGLPSQAQSETHGSIVAGPEYDSGFSAGLMSDANLNTPEVEGRPGWKFFELGSLAFKKGDYSHAIAMFKVASSWAYKPAEYDLGVMYFNGDGVPVNRPLGAAWMILAAERGDSHYAKLRDEMVTMLTDSQFSETDKLWAKLRKTYGDKVALRRAMAQWVFVKNQMTGSHLGADPGELRVGVGRGAGTFMPAGEISFVGLGALTPAGSTEGSTAYRQFQQSDNPYSPIFLENHKGTATVGPLQQLKQTGKRDKAKAIPTPSSSSSSRKKQRDPGKRGSESTFRIVRFDVHSWLRAAKWSMPPTRKARRSGLFFGLSDEPSRLHAGSYFFGGSKPRSFFIASMLWGGGGRASRRTSWRGLRCCRGTAPSGGSGRRWRESGRRVPR